MARILLLSLLMIACSAAAGAQALAHVDNKAITRRYFEEILNKGNLETLAAVVTADVVLRNPPVIVRGIDDFRRLVIGLRAVFRDLHFTLEDELGEGDRVATRWVMRGTQGDRKIEVSGMNIFLLANGRIKDVWVNMDTLAQATQLGQVPGP
jgi:predicted ester cyclase